MLPHTPPDVRVLVERHLTAAYRDRPRRPVGEVGLEPTKDCNLFCDLAAALWEPEKPSSPEQKRDRAAKLLTVDQQHVGGRSCDHFCDTARFAGFVRFASARRATYVDEIESILIDQWCRVRGLNSRPTVYKTAALPLS
jgi:hypothetical protein